MNSRPALTHIGNSGLRPPASGLLFSEPTFNEILYLERRRSERTGEPFLFMLLTFRQPSINGSDREFLSKVVAGLHSASRESDIQGWYKSGSKIGVLYTGIERTKVQEARQVIRGKVQDALSTHLALSQLHRIQLSFHLFPEEIGSGDSTDTHNLVLYPDLTQADQSRWFSRWLKRAVDVLGSLSLLILLLPLLLLIALLIRYSSKGPILFRQQRVGKRGELFTFLKFRSMYVDSDHEIHRKFIQNIITGKTETNNSESVYKITNDPRVTPVGKWLRKTSLDELPQLTNVLMGHMSLVGPRPPIPYEYQSYDVWHRRRVLEVQPGITGLWQVEGRSRTTFNEMVRMDLQYARDWSVWLDLKILLKTPWAVFTTRGAY